MIDFHSPTLADRQWVAPLLAADPIPLCGYNFTNLFCWQKGYAFQLARFGDRVLSRLNSFLGHAYLWPAGMGDAAPALEAIIEDAHNAGQPLRLISLTSAKRDWLEETYPGRFDFQEVRDAFDYQYDIHRLANLPGKKLQAKRNHIHRLDDNCPGWSWAPITEEDIPACLDMDRLWRQDAAQRETPEGRESLDSDWESMTLAFRHRKELGLDGILLRWQDEILGFTMGSPLTDTVYDVHFERARSDIQGAFPAVNRSFARYLREKYPAIRYLDREEDMGLPGLRKAKLSYRPDCLQTNICAVEAAF